MRQFHTSVVVRRQVLTSDFQTPPYESAWAQEAVYFIRLENVRGQDTCLNAAVQISPDGLHWVDEGTAFAPMTADGLYFVRVRHFGGWLRLNCTLSGADPSVEALIYSVLKE
jgi:hypothetical protein